MNAIPKLKEVKYGIAWGNQVAERKQVGGNMYWVTQNMQRKHLVNTATK